MYRRLFRQVRQFNYSDLRFLYISCLVTLALVVTIFRLVEFNSEQDELQTLNFATVVGQQQIKITELEKLLIRLEGSPQSNKLQQTIKDHIQRIIQAHKQISGFIDRNRNVCVTRRCQILKEASGFEDLMAITSPDLLIKYSLALFVPYREALADAVNLAFVEFEASNDEKIRLDIIEYFVIILLLLVQAFFIFRPAIQKINASLTLRSDFLSRISHEIRNPMNSILGMADLIKATPLNFEQEQYLTNLIRSGRQLLELLNNLIDFSSAEKGHLAVNPIGADLFQALDHSINLVATQAHHKGLKFYVLVDGQIPNTLILDTTRLEQVLLNLLSNSVKFTESGYFGLQVDLLTENETSVSVKFSVFDSGIGIPSDQLSEIFESFVQADSSIRRKYGGSGLGLSIARELVRQMGGDLKVESVLGQGSNLFFEIQLNKQNPAQKYLARLNEKTLVYFTAEKELTYGLDFFKRLTGNGHVFHKHEDLSDFLTGSPSPAVAHLLIDDSAGVVSMIKARNLADRFGFSENAIACIPSNFTKENMDLLKRNGFSKFLVQPLRPWDLVRLPAHAIQDNYTNRLDSDFIFKIRQRNLRILLVDDSDDNLFLLQEVIQPLASIVHVAENGLEAIEKFSTIEYDVVYMDIQMPIMDGYTAVKKMRSLESSQKPPVPIFAVTAHSGLVDAQKCREAGFTDRIVKPVSRAGIIRSLAKFFTMDTADKSIKQDTVMNEAIGKLLPVFYKARLQDMQKLSFALDESDFSKVGLIAHKIKGSALTFGFSKVGYLGDQLESCARNEDSDSCRSLVQQLKTELTLDN